MPEKTCGKRDRESRHFIAEGAVSPEFPTENVAPWTPPYYGLILTIWDYVFAVEPEL